MEIKEKLYKMFEKYLVDYRKVPESNSGVSGKLDLKKLLKVSAKIHESFTKCLLIS